MTNHLSKSARLESNNILQDLLFDEDFSFDYVFTVFNQFARDVELSNCNVSHPSMGSNSL